MSLHIVNKIKTCKNILIVNVHLGKINYIVTLRICKAHEMLINYGVFKRWYFPPQNLGQMLVFVIAKFVSHTNRNSQFGFLSDFTPKRLQFLFSSNLRFFFFFSKKYWLYLSEITRRLIFHWIRRCLKKMYILNILKKTQSEMY